MVRQARLQATLLGSLLLFGCATGQKHDGSLPVTPKSKEEAKLKSAIAELKMLYQSVQSEHERRAVSLRAIDDGAISRGALVTNVDEIFGTRFASDLPTAKVIKAAKSILFANQLSPSPRPDGIVAAVPYVGWYLDVDYDHDGIIQNYYLSNLHKGLSRRDDERVPMSIADLSRLYAIAKSEHERRAVAIRAIDEGVIQTFGPVNISTVDAIFGTQLASQLPTKKEDKRTGIVDFASFPTTSSGTGKDGARTSNGWFMAVEYYSNGNIANYYLTNVSK